MRFTVRVPATSANLGPGYDSFGLALDLCNEVTVDTDAPQGVEWTGEGADELPTDGTDMVSVTMQRLAHDMQVSLPPLKLAGDNRIPLERGLGSSSAAAVAGVVAASLVLDIGLHREPHPVFAAAAKIEGHPDNAAPCAYGGLTVALPDGAVRRFEPHPDLRPVVIVPDVRLLTAEAREALPSSVPMADAVFNVAHAALVVESLTTDTSLLTTALQDRLHQEARLRMVPDVAEVFEQIRRSHLPACVSGAGPSLLVFEREPDEVTHERFDVPGTWRMLRPGVRRSGFEVVDRDG